MEFNLFKEILKEHSIIYNKEENDNGWIKNISCFLKDHKDSKPSASINFKKKQYHCFGCDKFSKGEAELIQLLENCSFQEAHIKIIEFYEKKGLTSPLKDKEISPDFLNKIKNKFGIEYERIKKWDCFKSNDNLKCSIKIRQKTLDIKTLNLKDPNSKFFSAKGAKAGLIYPYNHFIKQDLELPVFIMAGEKDLFLALAMGLNAITITGGEKKRPNKMFDNLIKNRTFYIIYDNDKAGKKQGKRLSIYLLKRGAKKVFNITSHHLVCKEKGEDFWDYFFKYKNKKSDFDKLINNAKPVKEIDPFSLNTPKYSIYDAIKKGGHFTWLQSECQIRAIDNSKKIAWSFFKITGPNNFSYAFDLRDIKLFEEKMLYIGNQKENKIKAINFLIEQNILKPEGKKVNYKQYQIIKIETETLWTYYLRTVKGDNNKVDIKAYITKEVNLRQGEKYQVIYKLINSPFKQDKNEMVIVIGDIYDKMSDNIENFKIKKDIKTSLKKFRGLCIKTDLEGVSSGWYNLFTEFKKNTKPFFKHQLFTFCELTFNSVFKIPFKRDKATRGVLHTLIIGDSGVGKSEITKQMRKLYKAGHKVDLQNTTITSLVGGTETKGGNQKTVLGVLPNQHKRLLILEEVGRSDKVFHSRIAEIRSDGVVNISRVENNITAPCVVRQIETANQPINKGVVDFKNGKEIITSLVPDFQDIRRYDLFFIMAKGRPEDPDKQETLNPISVFNKDDYHNRILWVWSRKPQDVFFNPGTINYIKREAFRLEKKYDIRFQMFGHDTGLLIARWAVAAAAALVSTDDKYEKVIVHQGHVQFVIQEVLKHYEGPVFRLDKYAKEEMAYKTIQKGDYGTLCAAYRQSYETIERLIETSSSIKKSFLRSGLADPRPFNEVVRLLNNHKLVRITGNFEKIAASRKMKKLYQENIENFKRIKMEIEARAYQEKEINQRERKKEIENVMIPNRNKN